MPIYMFFLNSKFLLVLDIANIFLQVLTWLLNLFLAAAAAKSLQSCLTLCNPRDGSPPGPAVPGILQTRTLELEAQTDLSPKKKYSPQAQEKMLNIANY